MLQRIETEISQPRGVGVAVDAEHATLFAKLVQLNISGIVHVLLAVTLVRIISRFHFVQLFARLSSCWFTGSDYCSLLQLSTLAFVLVAARTLQPHGFNKHLAFMEVQG